jgi:hypothetical protein
MRRTIKGLVLLVALLVTGCLMAGCGSTVKSAAGNLPSRTVTSGGPASPTPTPTPTVTPTAVPSTAFTTVTATATPPAAVTSSAAPAGSPTAAASGSSTSTSLIWLAVALGVLVLAGLITWIARSGHRRAAAAACWQSRLIDVYAKGSALHDAMSVAEQGDRAGDAARSRWYDIQRRADDLAQTLYGLREAARDPGDQGRIADVLASLQTARSAMDAERAPGGAGPEQADVVRSRLYAFELSLRALRAGSDFS